MSSAIRREQIAKYFGRVTEPIPSKRIMDGAGKAILRDEYGRVRHFYTGAARGDYTDDTILTLALAQSIAEVRGINIDDIAKKQLQAYEACRLPSGKVAGGFGGTTRAGFENLRKGISPLKSGVTGGPGNAPAMKMAPVGMYIDATGGYEEGLNYAEQIGRITHLDPRSIASGVVQAHAIYALLNGVSRQEFLDSLAGTCARWEKPATPEFQLAKSGSLTSRISWIRNNKDATTEAAYGRIGSTSVVMESYPFAIFMLQKYWENPLEGLIETVNFGGDCDTTGAIYGALSGAKNGLCFPDEWLKLVPSLELMVEDADMIHGLKHVK